MDWKWVSLGLMLLAGIVGGCNRDQSAATTDRFRVALLLPGSANDKGWNQLASEGLDRIAAELDAEVKLIEKVSPSDFESQINYLASDGYDAIICHGGEFEKTVAQAAQRYPNVAFIVGGCPNDIPGAVAVEFMTHDASMLVGIVAAEVSRTRSAAFVGAMKVPTLEACYNGMADGIAQAGGSAMKLLPALWTDSWDSPARAKETTETALNTGADVIYQNVDAAAVGVFEAVEAANRPDRPAYAFGCNSNQNDLNPNVILGSVAIDVPRTYLELVRDAKAGTLQRGKRNLGLQGGYVDLLLSNHPAVTDAVQRKVSEARARILASSAN